MTFASRNGATWQPAFDAARGLGSRLALASGAAWWCATPGSSTLGAGGWNKDLEALHALSA